MHYFTVLLHGYSQARLKVLAGLLLPKSSRENPFSCFFHLSELSKFHGSGPSHTISKPADWVLLTLQHSRFSLCLPRPWDTIILKLGQLISITLPRPLSAQVKGRVKGWDKMHCCLILRNCHGCPNIQQLPLTPVVSSLQHGGKTLLQQKDDNFAQDSADGYHLFFLE